MDAVMYALMQAIPAQQAIPETTWAEITAIPPVSPTSTDKQGFYTPLTLPDGRVFVTGVWNGSGPTENPAHTWMWDPATPTVWTQKADMDVPRWLYAASVRSDGKVLVSGGVDASGTLASTSVYDPATNAWSAGPTMPKGRNSHVQMTLGNGDVLVVGGWEVTSGTNAESGTSLLSVAGTGAWSAKASLPSSTKLYDAAAVTLADGNGLVLGGYTPGGGVSTGVYRYNRAANTWSTRAVMPGSRAEFAAAIDVDGIVYALGGRDPSYSLYNVDKYDPVANTWSPATSLPRAQSVVERLKVTTLADGRFLAIGGYDDSTPADGSAQVRTYTPPRIVAMPGRGNLLAYIAAQE